MQNAKCEIYNANSAQEFKAGLSLCSAFAF